MIERQTEESAQKPIATTRKVIKCGPSFYLCLPKAFVKKHRIQKGELLPIVAGDGILKIVVMKQ